MPAAGLFDTEISRESLSQQAYLAIRRSLMRSRLEPGQKLIARLVAQELGISVTPVRESLLRLVSESLLVMDDRGTVTVPELTLARAIEIRDLRMLLEGEGAARAAGFATEADVDKLKQIHEQYVSTEGERDFATALTENEAFHFTVCRLAQSPVLFRVVENLWIQFGPLLAYLYEGNRRPFHGDTHAHVLVIDALRSRNPEQARRAIGQDILVGGKAVLEKLSQMDRPGRLTPGSGRTHDEAVGRSRRSSTAAELGKDREETLRETRKGTAR